MNSTEIFNVLDEIAATASKTSKEALVKKHLDDPEFHKVCLLAYDPFIIFGVGAKTIEEARALSVERYGPAEGSDNMGPNSWLLLEQLIKREITGDAVIDRLAYEFSNLNPQSEAVLRRILLKDLRAGFTDGTINRVRPGTLPDFPYMRCSLPPKSNMAKWKWEEGIFSQEKADGMFANCDHYNGGAVAFRTRQGTPFPVDSLLELNSYVRDLIIPGTQTHGEMLVYRKQPLVIEGHNYGYEPVLLPREEGNGILNSLLKGGSMPEDHYVFFQVWDQIALDAVKSKGKYPVPYAKRFRALLEQLRQPKAAGMIKRIGVTPTKIVKSNAEAMAHYREFLAAGKEGTILKSPSGEWRDGTSKDQCKLKLEVSVELRVVGFNEGTGKYADTLGSLVCRSECGRLEVNVNGRGDAMRDEIWANKDAWDGAIIAVKANGIIDSENKPGMFSLFLPVFVERRYDKPVADTLEQIQAQFEAAVRG